MAKSGGLGRFYWLLVLLAAVGAGAVGFAVRSKRTRGSGTGPVAMPTEDPTGVVAAARGMTKGDSAAPITILEFADFECPYCSTFATEIGPQIEEELIATGKARFVFHDFPLVHSHKHAFLAARAARCAGDQQKFWEYHDALYKTQTMWAALKDPAAQFEALATELGLDGGAFKACLESDRHTDLVTANMKLGEMLRVDRTPIVIVTQGRGMGQKVVPTMEAIVTAVEAMGGR